VLLISGSPRDGNTNFLLRKILDGLKLPTECILLKDMDIKHCIGCLTCHTKSKCAIDDDMDNLLSKMVEAEVIVIGTPNYFDNVSGLLKDFIDRTHPLYKSEALKGKKLFLIMVGGGSPEGTQKFLDSSTYGFIKYQKLELTASYCFKALDKNDVEKGEDTIVKVNKVIEEINNVL